MGATLAETFKEAFRAGKEDIVKSALSRRLKIKRNIRDGKSVSRIDRNNARISPNETAIGALKDSAEKAGISRDAEIAKDRAARKKRAEKKKKNIFGIGQAAANIRKLKNKDL